MNRQFRQIERSQDNGHSESQIPRQPHATSRGLQSSWQAHKEQYLQIESDPVVEQDTIELAVAHESPSPFFHKILDHLPMPVQRVIIAILNRVRDPEPERTHTRSQAEEESQVPMIAWGWLPILSLISTLGMLLVAYAFKTSLYYGTGLQTFFVFGMLLIFMPTAVRLLFPGVSRFERISLLCVVGICLYLVKVMSSPLYFSFYDEFLHWRTVDDIARSGHLFSENALLPVSPYYPGLEIVTNALSTVSGLSTFHAGLIVIGVARLVMILSLFLLNEQITGSTRIAGIATILYMTNPHFLLFDGQFAYESLALPLAALVMFAMAPHQMISVRLTRLQPMAPFVAFAKTGHKWLNSDLRWITLTAWIILVAVALTHHVTDFFLDGILICWTVAYGFLRLTPLHRSNLTKTALLGVLLAVASTLRTGNPVVVYLSSFLGNALNELGHILAGTGGARQLFVTYTGQPTPVWERMFTISSVALIMLCFPFGFLCLWQRYRSNALACMFGIISLFYPLSQVFRFTNSGVELTDRAAAFLFVPIATILAILIVQFWPIRQLKWKHYSLITFGICVVFLGSTFLGAGPDFALLPGPYAVVADTRSIEIDGIQSARWANSYLGPNNRIATDRINQILMGTYGDDRIVTSIEDKVDISPIFFSSSLGPNELSILRSSRPDYLVVDLRLAKGLPLLGFYFEEGEVGAYQRTSPIDLKALTKFSTIPQINRVFDSGNIIIYDVRGLINASEKP